MGLIEAIEIESQLQHDYSRWSDASSTQAPAFGLPTVALCDGVGGRWARGTWIPEWKTTDRPVTQSVCRCLEPERFVGASTAVRLSYRSSDLAAGRSGSYGRLNPDRLLDDPLVVDWNRHDDYMPYWAYLWPAAYLLAERVAREPWRRRRAGARTRRRAGDRLRPGTGRPGRGWRAVYACSSATMTTAPLEFVVRSAVENGFDPARYSTRRLDWRNLPDEQHAIILGADVLYEARLVPLVAGLLDRLLAPGGLGLLASPDRVAAKGFPAAAAPQVGAVRADAEAATARSEDGQSIEGTIYRVTRRSCRRQPRFDRSVPMIERTLATPCRRGAAARSSTIRSDAVGS